MSLGKVYKFNSSPSSAIGKDADIGVYKNNLYFKSNGRWIRVGGDVKKVKRAFKDELAIWGGKGAIRSNSNLKFKDNEGLKIKKVDNATSDTDKFIVIDDDVIKYRTGSEVLSDIGGSSTSGTVTEVTVGTGLDVTNGTTTPAITLDLSELADGTGLLDGAVDELIYLDNGTQKRKLANEIRLSAFVNDLSSFTAAGGITAGAVIWQYLPFHILSATNGRHYYVDNDGYTDSARKWDSYDTDPTGFNYRSVTGNFVVPEDCTLVAMHGVIANQNSTNNPTITIYHGTITEGTGDTTLASAGAVTPTTGTMRVPFKFSKTDFDADLSAGDIVVPTISHADSGGTRTFTGSLTLKFITR